MRFSARLALAACLLPICAHPAPARAPVPSASMQPQAIADRTVTVGTQRFHYLQAGTGATAIVLLHGWPQSSYEWRRVMPLLADRYTVIAPDLPGVGGTSASGDDFAKATLARDIRGLVTKLGLKHIVLVGHDIGGMVAYAYARLYPGDLAGVAILDVPVPGVAPWEMVKTIPQAWHFGFHQQQPLAEQLVSDRQAIYFRYFIDSHADNPAAIADTDVAAYAAAYGSAQSLHAGFGFYRAFAADETFNASHREPLDVPLLLGGAEHSMASGETQLEQGLKALGVRDVSVVNIMHSGHWIAEEQPAATADLIAAFAARVSKAR